MKKLMLILIAALAVSQGRAQITIAPEVGINWSKISESDCDGLKRGFKAGAMLDVPVIKGFFVQSGLFYSGKGVKTYTAVKFREIVVDEIWGNIGLRYLELPVNLGYRYSLGKAGRIFVTAGPYLAYAFQGKRSTRLAGSDGIVWCNSKGDVSFGSGDQEMSRLDYGLNFSAGYQLPVGLYVRAQYGLGLANLVNNSEGSFKNRVLAFSLGYAFPLGGK